MSTIKNSTENKSFDEDNPNYKVIRRRQSKRRETDRRQAKPQFLSNEQIRNLRKVDQVQVILLRMGHRRSSDRRISVPKLLSIDEIEILRTKTK
ncbi:MAG: hypothetical protein HRT93_07675 [Piscirickettsiaceae bacterium]|nr:hypothetical protein [Piscirickettsiaceae bacterium]